MQKTTYNRILLEINGDSLAGDLEYGIDPVALAKVAEQIKQVYTKHVQIAITLGGANIFKGFEPSRAAITTTTLDYIDMMATAMNGLALQDALESIGIPTRLQSALNMPAIAENFIRRKAVRHMEKGRVVILCAGTGVPFVSTDTSSCLHALELGCDIVLKTTQQKAVVIGSKRYATLSFADLRELPEQNYVDPAALTMLKENNVPIMIFELFGTDNLVKAVSGESVGTLISNQVTTTLAE